jgi:hypothetical protein
MTGLQATAPFDARQLTASGRAEFVCQTLGAVAEWARTYGSESERLSFEAVLVSAAAHRHRVTGLDDGCIPEQPTLFAVDVEDPA